MRRGDLLSLLGVLEFGRWVLQGAPSRSDGPPCRQAGANPFTALPHFFSRHFSSFRREPSATASVVAPATAGRGGMSTLLSACSCRKGSIQPLCRSVTCIVICLSFCRPSPTLHVDQQPSCRSQAALCLSDGTSRFSTLLQSPFSVCTAMSESTGGIRLLKFVIADPC